MKFQEAINKCVQGMIVSNNNMTKEYLQYDNDEKRILWWDSKTDSHWSYPADKDSAEFIKELNLEWYECDKKGIYLKSDKIAYLNCGECDNNTFFLRKRGKTIEVICIKCGDDSKLNDAKNVKREKE